MRYFALHIILIAAAAVSAQVRSTMSGTDFLVGDYITIEQTAELRPGQEIMWPSAKVDDLNLEVIGEKFDTVASEITRTITYIQFDSGSYVYPARAIQVLESGDTTTVFETAAFSLQGGSGPPRYHRTGACSERYSGGGVSPYTLEVNYSGSGVDSFAGWISAVSQMGTKT